MIIVNGSHSATLARSVARKLNVNYSRLTISSFPDGDMYLRFTTSLNRQTVVIVQSFHPDPDHSLLEVIFAAETARDLGARKVMLVAPYLAYMRQDKRFKSGEAISSKIMAKLVNGSFDRILTIDPHLHRYRTMGELFTISVRKLTANDLIAQYVKRHFPDAIVTGPDWESSQWAAAIARKAALPSIVLEKKRFHARKVKVSMVSPVNVRGKDVVIIDDIISTGHTVAEAAKLMRKNGAARVYAIGVHGIFVEGALRKLIQAGVRQVITCNTIEHPTNAIDVSPLIAEALRRK
jgi:ribose-phosphate pyrophosphokinase